VTAEIDLSDQGEPGDEGGAGDGSSARLLRLFDLRLQEAAYRAALAGRETLIHPSLLDFLR
jgi:hypothetical protein